MQYIYKFKASHKIFYYITFTNICHTNYRYTVTKIIFLQRKGNINMAKNAAFKIIEIHRRQQIWKLTWSCVTIVNDSSSVKRKFFTINAVSYISQNSFCPQIETHTTHDWISSYSIRLLRILKLIFSIASFTISILPTY